MAASWRVCGRCVNFAVVDIAVCSTLVSVLPVPLPPVIPLPVSLTHTLNTHIVCFTSLSLCIMFAGSFSVQSTDNSGSRTVHFSTLSEPLGGGVTCDDGNCHILVQGDVCRHILAVSSEVALQASIGPGNKRGASRVNTALVLALQRTRWFHTRGGRSIVVDGGK